MERSKGEGSVEDDTVFIAIKPFLWRNSSFDSFTVLPFLSVILSGCLKSCTNGYFFNLGGNDF